MDTARAESATARSIAGRALGVAAAALDAGERALHAKLAVEHAVDDSLRAAREVVRQGSYAAEDFVDRAALRIRRKPLRSVVWSFACGVIVGGAALCAIGGYRGRRDSRVGLCLRGSQVDDIP